VEQTDAIVIGAGHNGLVAANLLADAGWSVEVLEATPHPGGAVRSGYVTAPGYLSDLFSSSYPLGFASPVLAGLDLPEYGLEWTHAPDVFTHLLPDGRAATVSRDLGTTMASMERFAPGDGERWRDAYEQWRDVSPYLLRVLFEPFPPVRSGLELARRLRVAGSLRLARRLMLSARELGEELFRGEGARLALAGCALHTDLSPQDAGGGVYGWLLAMLGQQVGFPVPVGGAQRITSALVRRLADRGGRITYEAPVTRVATGAPAWRCSPTSRRRRCTWTWSAPGGCRRRSRGTWSSSAGTARRSRSTGRWAARSRGATRRWPAPASCTSAPT
jgi:phytoene dehydrogenase-like protein